MLPGMQRQRAQVLPCVVPGLNNGIYNFSNLIPGPSMALAYILEFVGSVSVFILAVNDVTS